MGYKYAPHIPRPSEQLADLMMGRATWDNSPASIRSLAQKHIFDAAIQILDVTDIQTRRAMISRVPPHMRGMVEDEIKREFAYRQANQRR